MCQQKWNSTWSKPTSSFPQRLATTRLSRTEQTTCQASSPHLKDLNSVPVELWIENEQKWTIWTICCCLSSVCFVLFFWAATRILLSAGPNSKPSRGPAQAANSPKFTTPLPSCEIDQCHLALKWFWSGKTWKNPLPPPPHPNVAKPEQGDCVRCFLPACCLGFVHIQ